MKNPIPVYRRILNDFQEGKLSPDEFVRQYHEEFFADGGNYDDALWRVINEAAGAAEFYTDNPRLLASNPDLYLDEGKLRATVKAIIVQLDEWHPHWDYNSHRTPNSPWQNFPHGGMMEHMKVR